ncbi:hypothetical protein [Marilutibacter maris]|uniref:hypothetical protein n=1 Tax=Marilutibacter maris TaxID=1605891 RepID=UPI0011AEAF3E|nr:hypothetical protein [Lysobacter maris]
MRLGTCLFAFLLFLGAAGHSVAFAQDELVEDPGTCGMPPFDGPPYCDPDIAVMGPIEGDRDAARQARHDEGQTSEQTGKARRLPIWNYSITGQSF